MKKTKGQKSRATVPLKKGFCFQRLGFVSHVMVQ
jgi:hypothetical protein